MAHVHLPRPWELDERLATPESVYVNRRAFLGAAGLGATALALGACAGDMSAPPEDGAAAAAADPHPYHLGLYPAGRSDVYKLDRELTDEDVAARVINYYEFTTDKAAVRDLAREFPIEPWTVEVTGLVEKPRQWSMDEILRTFPVEERLYRHRCVEAWAMTVPWSGIPMAAFVAACRPLSSARFVRMVGFHLPEHASGQKTQTWYPWPYHEGLTMAEAVNELTLLATGIYGHAMPNEHGAPLRLVVPWKYGYKSIKGIVRFEFVASQPPTFWNALEPREYDFTSNVNPEVPHPRWSQAMERLIGTDLRVETRHYNGYGEQVAHLYA